MVAVRRIGMALAACRIRQQEIPTLPFLTTNPVRKDGGLWSYALRAAEPGGQGTLRKETSGGGAALATGYCVKCKASREIKDAKQSTRKSGSPAHQGIG